MLIMLQIFNLQHIEIPVGFSSLVFFPFSIILVNISETKIDIFTKFGMLVVLKTIFCV